LCLFHKLYHSFNVNRFYTVRVNWDNKRYIGFLENMVAAADAIQAKTFTQQQRSYVVEGSADWIVLEALKKFEFTHSEVWEQIVVDSSLWEKHEWLRRCFFLA
jgi:hypothetical protein